MNDFRLADIAHGRSGDKGNHANVAVIAYTDAGFAWLRNTSPPMSSPHTSVRSAHRASSASRRRIYWRSISCCTTCWPAAQPIIAQ